MVYIQLGLAALCPAAVSAAFYWCNKKTAFSNLSIMPDSPSFIG